MGGGVGGVFCVGVYNAFFVWGLLRVLYENY